MVMTSICLLTRSKTSCQAWRPTTGLLNYAGSPTPPLAERASADTINPAHSRNQLPADLLRGGRLGRRLFTARRKLPSCSCASDGCPDPIPGYLSSVMVVFNR